jgi:hypothetical protein
MQWNKMEENSANATKSEIGGEYAFAVNIEATGGPVSLYNLLGTTIVSQKLR